MRFELLRNKNLKSLALSSWQVSWPMTSVMVFIFFIGIADVYVAGKISKEIQAGYGIASQIYLIFSIIAMALTVGTVSVLSRLFTARHKDFNAAVDSSVISACVLGLVLTVPAVIFSPDLIKILHLPLPVQVVALPLMRIFAFGLLFNYFLINTNGILRACGMTKKSMWTMCLVCILNVVLNFILAFRTPLHFKGIAVATVISTIAGCGLNIYFLRKSMSESLMFSLAIAKKIFFIGYPAGLMQMLWQLASLALFLIISSLPVQNVEILAAFTNGIKIESAIFLPAFAFNMAAAVLIGNLIGKNNKTDAFRSGIVTALAGVALVSVMTLIVLLNARQIAMLLSNNEIVVNECVRYIHIALLFEPVMAWGVILAGGLNGAGDTKTVMWIVSLSVWIIRVPLSLLCGLYWGWGAASIWWAMNLSVLAQSIFLTYRYFSKKWLLHAHQEIQGI